MKDPIVLGIDPSCQSKHTGIAVMRGEEVLALSTLPLEGDTIMQRILNMPKSLSALLHQLLGSLQPALVCVEGQDLRGHHARPQNIVHLATAAGIILGTVTQKVPVGTPIYMPRPVEWKGSVPKDVKLQRILKRLGMERSEFGPTKDQQEHVIEACGLALWALDQARTDGSL